MAVLRTLIGLAATAMLLELAMAANYTVGGTNGGWDTTTNLQTWASSQKFTVGDNLIFQYLPNHNVVEVSKADCDSCQTGNAIQSYSDGNTVIPLSSPGKRYFVCGTPGHCSQGMKLEVDTLAATSSPTASPSLPPQASAETPVPEASPLSPEPASPAPETSSAQPGESPKFGLSGSPSRSPRSFPDDPSIKTPSSSPLPSRSSRESQQPSLGTKDVCKITFTMGFSLGIMMLLAL